MLKTVFAATIFVSTTLLAGCGGGSGGGDSPPAVATVTSIVPDALVYGKVTKFTVTGANLDNGVSVVAPTCGGIIDVAGGTTTQRSFTCTPSVTGSMAITLKNTSGAVLLAISPQIPLPNVIMKTSMGDVVFELYPNNAPVTVNNFLQYVSSNFYSNLVFHRVVPNFVIQGGGFTANLQAATTLAPIKLEMPNGLSNLRGTLAMARTASLDSATSQFFINTVNNTSLDISGGGYAVFGKVVTGLTEVVDKISAVPTQTIGSFADVPVTPVTINSITRTQ